MRTRQEVMAELAAPPPVTETPWSRWDRLVYRVTGRVSARVYGERMVGLATCDAHLRRLRAELDYLDRIA